MDELNERVKELERAVHRLIEITRADVSFSPDVVWEDIRNYHESLKPKIHYDCNCKHIDKSPGPWHLPECVKYAPF